MDDKNKPMSDPFFTVGQFLEDHPELKDKEIVRCEHLQTSTTTFVTLNLWIGENTRLLLCPICEKVHAQTIINATIKACRYIMDVSKGIEYSEWLKGAGENG